MGTYGSSATRLEQSDVDARFDRDPATSIAGALVDVQRAVSQVQTLLRHPQLDVALTHDLTSRRRSAVRMIIGMREIRDSYFGGNLFADPAWNILLDAYASALDDRRISVSDACIASGVPNTTALRWLKALEDRGLIKRENDERDRRRAFVTLTPHATSVLEKLIDEVIQRNG